MAREIEIGGSVLCHVKQNGVLVVKFNISSCESFENIIKTSIIFYISLHIYIVQYI